MHQHGHDSSAGQHSHHIVPISVYVRIWVGLIVLTVVTVLSSYIDFGGSTNILIAMAIATTKALLVVLYFMGLKYDGLENNVTFFGTFFFLVLFVSLTSFDIFYRRDDQPVKVDASEMASSANAVAVDVNALVKPMPEYLAKGKAVFAQQCVSCHGAEGKGDGAAAAALNPKPRNFTQADGWKNGRGIADIFKTLANGIPGSPMPAFASLSVEDRFALIHFVRSLGPTPAADKPEAMAQLQKEAGGAGHKPRISVQKAMDKLVQEYQEKHH